MSITFGNGDLKAAMMATVVLNLSGLMSGLLQLFLRSNTATTSFGPKSERSWERKKHEIRIWGPNELAFNNQLVDPVSGPGSPAELDGRTESRTGLVGLEKGRAISMESLRSPPFNSQMRYNPLASNTVVDGRKVETMVELPTRSPQRTHARKQSYSLFPAEASTDKANTRPELTSVYDISGLEPPPPVFGGGLRGLGHRRDSSIASSATVQIGLRISHAISPSQEETMPFPLPSMTYDGKARPVSPLRIQTQKIPTSSFSQPSTQPQPVPVRSLKRPGQLNTTIKSPTQQLPFRGSLTNKTLPPTPRLRAPSIQRVMESTTQLSPTVYSPEKKLPKALNTPQSATVPLLRNPLSESPTGPQRPNSSRQPERKSKMDWI